MKVLFEFYFVDIYTLTQFEEYFVSLSGSPEVWQCDRWKFQPRRQQQRKVCLMLTTSGTLNYLQAGLYWYSMVLKKVIQISNFVYKYKEKNRKKFVWVQVKNEYKLYIWILSSANIL